VSGSVASAWPSGRPHVGILGGGQLARMLVLAGTPMGVRFGVFDSVADGVAGHVAPLTVGSFDDLGAIDRWVARGVDGSRPFDVVTYEFENVPVVAARHLESRGAVWPPAVALEESQDRVREKAMFNRLGIATAGFEPVHTREALLAAIARLGVPSLLKTRRLGYDGKGQTVIKNAADVERAWALLGPMAASAGGLVLEAFVPFERELSIVAARGRDGSVAFWPLTQNEHREGILRVSIAPAAGVSAELQAAAEGFARRVMEHLGYVGVLAIELFDLGATAAGGRLIANEMAPRVHNSGHWTIEGSQTSQFENHVRAVCGWPLGSTAMRWPGARAAMVNMIGSLPERGELLRLGAGVHWHDYGKQAKPGRKLGHVTVSGDDSLVRSALSAIREAIQTAELGHSTQTQ
jgi:5-(carboxyamino)imidazole ribonucleotide synthase